MAAIGRRGFASLVNRYFCGDREAATRWLHAHAAESQIAKLLDARRPQNGEIQCIEIPILLLPDDDPFFDDHPSWQERVARDDDAKGQHANPKRQR